jgi:glutathione S-transferase
MTTMDRLRIYGYPVSTWTRTVVMACIEKGADHELTPIAYGSADHARLHPFKRIPILEHEGTVICETLAITGYIDEALDGPALQPADLSGRTRMREWLSLCADYVYRDVVRAIPRKRAPTDDELDAARVALERVDALVGSEPFLLGDRVTLADLYLAPQISNAREKAPELLSSFGAVESWMTRIASRESFEQTAYDPTTF